jgi:putative transcriptional regulator
MSKMPSKATNKPSRLTRALLETAKDMRDGGVLTEPAYEKITLRHLGQGEVSEVEPITGQAIRTLREEAHMSQAVFARHLNLTVGYVSQLERGAKRPTGPALALLNIIRRKGIEAIL